MCVGIRVHTIFKGTTWSDNAKQLLNLDFKESTQKDPANIELIFSF